MKLYNSTNEIIRAGFGFARKTDDGWQAKRTEKGATHKLAAKTWDANGKPEKAHAHELATS